MDVAAPLHQQAWPGGGMPTAFRADASGAALQPLPASSDWQLLVDVEGFKPSYPTSDCGTCGGTCANGVLQHTFPILPQDAFTFMSALAPGPALPLASSAAAPEPALPLAPGPSAADPLPAGAFDSFLSISLADGVGTAYPVDIDALFVPQSRTYPYNITTAFRMADGPAGPLPSWLAFSWNVTLHQDTSEYNQNYDGNYDGSYNGGSQQHIPTYDAVYALSLTSYPGVAAIAQDTLVLTAADQSAAHPPPQVANLEVDVEPAGPSYLNDIPFLHIEDGQPFTFTIPNTTFQVNIPTPGLIYQANMVGSGESLPSWLTFSAVGSLSGTPRLGQDAYFGLNITGFDANGASSWVWLDLYVQAHCPAGLYRHFRLRLSPTNDNGHYQLARQPYNYYSANLKRSAICVWNIATAMPPPDQGYGESSFTTTGTSYQGGGYCSDDQPGDPWQAFQDVEESGGCSQGTWKVS